MGPEPKTSIPALLWTRFSWRHWRMAPVQSALLAAILALGIAVYFAIRLASAAAAANFSGFTEILSSESDGVISAPAGILPQSVLREIRAALGDTPVSLVAVLETTAAPPRTGDNEEIGSRRTYELLGVDLVAAQNLTVGRRLNRSWFNQRAGELSNGAPNRLWDTLSESNAVFVTQAFAQARGLRPGDSLPLVINEQVVSLQVAGILPGDAARPQAPSQMLVMDLPALQVLVGRPTSLSRVEIVLEAGPDRPQRWQAARKQLVEAGGSRWIVGTAADRRASGETMTRAFRLNLTILSLLALAVGLYLIFQALDGAVVRRREEIAVLRALGVTPREIQRAWLVEAAALGLVGSAAGLVLGWMGAQGAVRLVGRTVNALYYATAVDQAGINWIEAGLTLALGTLASLLAGWLPAKAAAEIPPAQSLGQGKTATFAGPALLRRLDIAILLIVGGIGLAYLPPLRLGGGVRLSLAAYIAALCWVLGAGIVGGALVQGLARLFRPFGRHFPTLRLGMSYLVEPSGRHRLALAGLVCAVSMTAAMAILVGSFNRTMTRWIARTFQADLYVTSDGAQNASVENRITPTVWRQIIDHPSVARGQVVQAARVILPGGDTLLVGSDLDFFQTYAQPAWSEAPVGGRLVARGAEAREAIVSESFAERFQVHRGAVIEVPSPTGPHSVSIAGVFSDYGNERGSLMIPRETYVAWFGDELAANLILILRPGQDPGALRAEFRKRFPGVAVFTQPHLRGEATRIFQQTFSITYALEVIGMAVAVAGLAFTMVSLLWERRDQLATLRALGMRRNEIAAAAAWEGALTASGGVLIGVLASVALGLLLVFVVNKQTFGWTLEMAFPWGQIAGLAGLVIAAASVTGWIAGRWGAQLPAEREEA